MVTRLRTRFYGTSMTIRRLLRRTQNNMPMFLEKKLKKEYPDNPGAVFGTMNKLGFMKGSKETKKGKAAEKKHKMAAKMESFNPYKDKAINFRTGKVTH